MEGDDDVGKRGMSGEKERSCESVDDCKKEEIERRKERIKVAERKRSKKMQGINARRRFRPRRKDTEREEELVR